MKVDTLILLKMMSVPFSLGWNREMLETAVERVIGLSPLFIGVERLDERSK